MDLLFLGTSSGVPTRQRNVSGLAVMPGRRWFLVDCGEGTQHRVLQAGLSLHDLQAICITHIHGDHCYGLPGLLSTAGMQGRQHALTLIAPAPVAEWLRQTAQLMDLYLPFELQVLDVAECGPWTIDGWTVESVALSHRVPSSAYVFTESTPALHLDREGLLQAGVAPGPLWGQLQRGQDVRLDSGLTLRAADWLRPGTRQRVVVAGDNDCPDLLEQACRTAQVLVHEATYTEVVDRDTRRQYGHSSAAEVAAFASRVELPNLLLTHFSPRYQADTRRTPSIADVHQEAQAHYHGQLFLAEDLARYHLRRDGLLERVNEANRPRQSEDGQPA